MRIVGGRLRWRALAAPKSQAIRPTADRLRESLFNILVHAYGDPVTGARVLDLFAGTGALGLEALSRGAAFALFVDDGAEARALLRENVAALGARRRHPHFPARCHQARRGASARAVLARVPRSALWPGPGRTGARLGARGRLAAPGALIVVEEAARCALRARRTGSPSSSAAPTTTTEFDLPETGAGALAGQVTAGASVGADSGCLHDLLHRSISSGSCLARVFGRAPLAAARSRGRARRAACASPGCPPRRSSPC